MDDKIQRGQIWLEEMLQLAHFPSAVSVEERTADSTPGSLETDSIWLTIDETNLQESQVEALLGTNGNVLDAVQYLANTILNLNQEREQQAAYTIELAGYRLRRQKELQSLAEQAIERVRETGEEFEIKALSAAERRQVHTFFKEFTDLETYSRGKEPDRRLVVRLLQD